MAIAPTLEELAVPLAELRPYPGNPRRGDLGAIQSSLRANGQFRPIVVNRRTRQVLGGNHLVEAARGLGWSEIAATYVDVDDEQARRIVLADNRTSDLATYDDEALADLLSELPDLEGTCYERSDLDALLDDLSPLEVDEEELPPVPAEPRTKPGDLYRLGSHRLLCGDAREAEDYARLMDGERAELLCTDPPYGVDYVGKTKRRLRIEGDAASGLSELLSDAFEAADPALCPGSPLYVAHPAGPLAATFYAAFTAAGWSLRQTLIWVKDRFSLGRSDYHYRHEPILYGFKPGEGRLGRGGRGWHGGNAEDSVIEVARPRASREHPTAKPAELIARLVRNSSPRGALVLDPFAGSGSTLAACESLGRRARLIELDPAYADVIVARWEALSGEAAELVR